MVPGGIVDGIDGVKKGAIRVYHVCKLGKLAAHPHPTVPMELHGSQQLALVVVGLAGPNKPMTLGGKMYDMVPVNAPLDLSHRY